MFFEGLELGPRNWKVAGPASSTIQEKHSVVTVPASAPYLKICEVQKEIQSE